MLSSWIHKGVGIGCWCANCDRDRGNHVVSGCHGSRNASSMKSVRACCESLPSIKVVLNVEGVGGMVSVIVSHNVLGPSLHLRVVQARHTYWSWCTICASHLHAQKGAGSTCSIHWRQEPVIGIASIGLVHVLHGVLSCCNCQSVSWAAGDGYCKCRSVPTDTSSISWVEDLHFEAVAVCNWSCRDQVKSVMRLRALSGHFAIQHWVSCCVRNVLSWSAPWRRIVGSWKSPESCAWSSDVNIDWRSWRKCSVVWVCHRSSSSRDAAYIQIVRSEVCVRTS